MNSNIQQLRQNIDPNPPLYKISSSSLISSCLPTQYSQQQEQQNFSSQMLSYKRQIKSIKVVSSISRERRKRSSFSLSTIQQSQEIENKEREGRNIQPFDYEMTEDIQKQIEEGNNQNNQQEYQRDQSQYEQQDSIINKLNQNEQLSVIKQIEQEEPNNTSFTATKNTLKVIEFRNPSEMFKLLRRVKKTDFSVGEERSVNKVKESKQKGVMQQIMRILKTISLKTIAYKLNIKQNKTDILK